MLKLFSVAEMQSLEKEANQSGLSYELMMENAGRGIANEIEIAYSHIQTKKIFALIGSGNNGGDTLISLSYLAKNNWETCAYIVRKRIHNDPLITRLKDYHGTVINIEEDEDYSLLSQLIESYSFLIDGILGTGIKLPLKDDIAKVLSFVKTKIKSCGNNLHIIAVDCPSGIDCDTGDASAETIPAEITVTMAGMKQGLIKFPAANFTGNIRYVSIGQISNLPAYVANKKIILSGKLINQFIPARSLDSHKGIYGTALIVAGSVNYTGAANLAGMAAYRIGVGLVTMAVPVPLHEALSGNFPEATWILLPHELGVISKTADITLKKYINRVTALLIGPGLGLEVTTEEFIRRVFTNVGDRMERIGFIVDEEKSEKTIKIQLPVVVDADGLKLLSKIANWMDVLPSPSVLTPHPGEMAILTGLTTQEIQRNRLEVAQHYSSLWGHIVVLKGAFTIIAEPNGDIAVVPVATAALAKAGTGDVLAGLITGLLAQGVDPYQAACAATWIHANAGLLAAKRHGNTASVIASDILNAIPQVITDLQ